MSIDIGTSSPSAFAVLKFGHQFRLGRFLTSKSAGFSMPHWRTRWMMDHFSIGNHFATMSRMSCPPPDERAHESAPRRCNPLAAFLSPVWNSPYILLTLAVL